MVSEKGRIGSGGREQQRVRGDTGGRAASAAAARPVRAGELLEHGDGEQERVAEQHAEVLAREQEHHAAARLAIRQHCDQLGHLRSQADKASDLNVRYKTLYCKIRCKL